MDNTDLIASERQHAQVGILAAALPNPIVRNAARPGPRLMRRAGRVGARYAEAFIAWVRASTPLIFIARVMLYARALKLSSP